MNEVIKMLASMKFAIIIFILIMIPSFIGAMLPQQTADFYIYKSFWFMGLQFFLFLSLLVCLIQMKLFSLFTFKKLTSFIVHGSFMILMVGALISEIFGKTGQMIISVDKESNKVIQYNNVSFDLPFSIYCDKFEIVYYDDAQIIVHHLAVFDDKIKSKAATTFTKTGIVNFPQLDYNVEVLQIIPDFSIDASGNVGSKSESWNNPALQVKVGNDIGWIFDLNKQPDFNFEKKFGAYYLAFVAESGNSSIKNYQSTLIVKENGNPVVSKVIEVNDPLIYSGYSFFQSAYDEKNLKYTVLHVNNDPGVWVFYSGCIILVIGLFLRLYVIAVRENHQ